MKRLSVVLIAVIVMSVLLSACGSGGGAAAADPVSALKDAMQAVTDKNFDKLAELTCAAKRDQVKDTFNPATALGASGIDPAKLLDAMTISLKDPAYTKVSEEGDKAVVQFKGTMSMKFDMTKFKAIMKEVLAAQGQTVSDAELDAGLAMITGELEQGQAMDEKVDMVKENGKWLMCPSN
jgi:hypothetical protein